MNRYLLSTAIVAATFVATHAAHAGCDDLNPGSGDTVTCAGAESKQIKSKKKNSNITVNVTSGAELDVKSKDAIKLKGDGTTVNNAGTIKSGDKAIAGGINLTVVNTGTIIAKDKAINAKAKKKSSGAKITNAAGALIHSLKDEGVQFGADGQLDNMGTIRAFDDALDAGRNALVNNYGLIENTQTQADLADPKVEAQDAIDIDSGIINNYASGVIRSTVNSAIDFDPSNDSSTITNSGTISGTIAINTDAADTGVQNVNLRGGVIEGTSGKALVLGQGDDAMVWSGGKLIGAADFGTGADRLRLASSLWSQPSTMFDGLGIFDGGLGADMVYLSGVNLSDTRLRLDGTTLSFTFVSGIEMKFINWEQYSFADGTYDYASLVSMAAVPLPAGGLLLGSALLGAGAIARRRKKAA